MLYLLQVIYVMTNFNVLVLINCKTSYFHVAVCPLFLRVSCLFHYHEFKGLLILHNHINIGLILTSK